MSSIHSRLITVILAMTASLVSVSCGGDSGDGQLDSVTAQEATTAPAAQKAAPQKRQRGGTITVGEQTWTIVPSVQCGVYPGDVVAIAGHAESDKQLEIVIDNDPGGRSGVSVGSERGAVSWHAVRDTLRIEVNGKQVRGTATFSAFLGGSGATAPGEFEVNC
jgi:hypothetical protein